MFNMLRLLQTRFTRRAHDNASRRSAVSIEQVLDDHLAELDRQNSDWDFEATVGSAVRALRNDASPQHVCAAYGNAAFSRAVEIVAGGSAALPDVPEEHHEEVPRRVRHAF